MNKEEIMQKAFECIVNPDLEETGKVYTEKEVAVIISVVSTMVGDPSPASNPELYMRLMQHMDLPENMMTHLMAMVMSARHALKQALSMSMEPRGGMSGFGSGSIKLD